MPTTLVVWSSVQVFFYYFFHVVFLGHPADILARLWLTHDVAYADPDEADPFVYEENVRKAWKNFDDSLRESYRNIGVLAGLVATATSLFFSVNAVNTNTTIRTLFLASVTTAVFSAASSLSLLSTVLPDPAALETRWAESGLGFILGLAGPSAWLSISLWAFQAALLALVWITDETPAKVVVTSLIGLMLAMRVTVATSAIGLRKFCQGLLGWKHDADHRMIQLSHQTIKLRKQSLGKACEGDQPPISRTASTNSEIRTQGDSLSMRRAASPECMYQSETEIPIVRVRSHDMRIARIFIGMPEQEAALQSATFTVAATAAATAAAPMSVTDPNTSIC